MRLCPTVVIVCLFSTTAGALAGPQYWALENGRSTLFLNLPTLEQAGLTVSVSGADVTQSGREINFPVRVGLAPLSINLATDGANGVIVDSSVTHDVTITLTTSAGSFVLGDVSLDPPGTPVPADDVPHLQMRGATMIFDPVARRMNAYVGEVALSPGLAKALGRVELAGLVIGGFESHADIEYAGGEPLVEPYHVEPTGDRTTCGGSAGPDVIVGDCNGISNYTNVGTIDAFSVGTDSCNMGTANLQWVASSVNHPVIPQNMYRRKVVNGATRFEHIGKGWMKHAFTALTQNLCCTCNNQGGSVLGVGCSDPYTSGRNGTQLTTTGGMGPRFQVNASTGGFIWPYAFRNTNGGVAVTSITRRVQVAADDLKASLNTGAVYYVEAQYVTPDDAANNNKNNNASYRVCTVSGGEGPNFSASNSGTTQREKPAIRAWKVADPTVTETDISTPENTSLNGLLILAAKATDLGGGIWHYEYALHNLNSDRSVGTFKVPVSDYATITNIGFHDVDFHSGDGFNSTPTVQVNYDGTDWPGAQTAGTVTWSYVPASPVENSNALRWANLMNFRFDCDVPPTSGNVSLVQFKVVNLVSASSVIPDAVTCMKGDANDDGIVDAMDVQTFSDLLLNGGATARDKCACDLEPSPDFGIDADDCDGFADCLINGGC